MPYKRKEVIGDCTLYLGDSMDILPTLGKVDAVVTDPPYSISVKGAVNNSPNGKRNFDFFKGDDDWKSMTDSVIKNVKLSIASMPKSVVYWCGHRQIGRITDTLEENGYSTRMLYWRKKCPPPSAPNSGFSSSVENAVYGYLSGRQWNGGQYEHNIFDADNYRHGQPDKVNHPTQKPLSLIKWNIELLTNKSDIILDCYLGSGTTLVACAKMGRKGIGIELDEDYFNIACRRVEQAYAQPDLFLPPPAKQVQETMPLSITTED